MGSNHARRITQLLLASGNRNEMRNVFAYAFEKKVM